MKIYQFGFFLLISSLTYGIESGKNEIYGDFYFLNQLNDEDGPMGLEIGGSYSRYLNDNFYFGIGWRYIDDKRNNNTYNNIGPSIGVILGGESSVFYFLESGIKYARQHFGNIDGQSMDYYGISIPINFGLKFKIVEHLYFNPKIQLNINRYLEKTTKYYFESRFGFSGIF